MKIFYAIDGRILAVCKKISHALQRGTGLTNFFVAKIGIAFTALNLLIGIGNYFLHFLRRPTPTIMICGPMMICLLSAILRSIDLSRAENDLLGVEKAQRHTLTSTPFWRLLWSGWSIIDALTFFLSPSYPSPLLEFCWQCLFSWGLTIFYYFVAVDPLPPAKSHIRGWMESLSVKTETAPARSK